MEATITKENSIADIYMPLFDDTTEEIVEPSGRSTGKTTHNEIAAVRYMLESKKNNIWYCRAETGDIENTIYASMLNTIEMMGFEKDFDSKKKPFKITCLKTGAVCYFTGINGKVESDVTSTKGFTPRGGTLKMCILDECDQVKYHTHITGWETTAARFLIAGAKKVFAYNPPANRNHWAHKFFGDKVRNGAARIYCTWVDISMFLNERAIKEILKYKRNDPLYYRFWYLGEPVNFTGMVYPQFKREKHIINIWQYFSQNPNDGPVELVLGLDEGTVNDSTCVTPLLILKSGIAVVLDLLEIDPLVIGQQAPTEASRRLWDFLIRLKIKFPFLANIPRQWIFECAEGGQMLMLQFRNDWGEQCSPITQKSIMGDIKRVRNMLAEGILLFHVDENVDTMILVNDIENYVFDEKTGDVKKQQRDDTIDSMEYATKLYYNTILT